MHLMLLGSPGAGKGTQAKKLADYYNIPQIAIGDILRHAIAVNSELGLSAQTAVASGQLVADEIIIRLFQERLQQADCNSGFLLDGFPRTLAQANALDTAGIRLDYIIEVIVPDAEIIKRLSGRRVHANSGRIYHIVFNPPKIDNVDDVTGESLVQRDDDIESTIKNRLDVYHQQTKPVIDYYRKLSAISTKSSPKFYSIDGTLTVKNVFGNIIEALKN